MAHAGLWLLAGVILGSVTGAATATFIAPRQEGAPQESASEFAARVGASMEQAANRAVERVRDEIEAARTEPANAASSDEPRVTSDPAPVARPRARAQEPVHKPPEPDSALLVRDGSAPLAEKNAARLELLVVRSRESRAARRRDWMFVGEKAVAAALGVPDSVSQQDGGREVWAYEIPFVNADGEQDCHSLLFTFAKGRVVEIDGADAIPEDR